MIFHGARRFHFHSGYVISPFFGIAASLSPTYIHDESLAERCISSPQHFTQDIASLIITTAEMSIYHRRTGRARQPPTITAQPCRRHAMPAMPAMPAMREEKRIRGHHYYWLGQQRSTIFDASDADASRVANKLNSQLDGVAMGAAQESSAADNDDDEQGPHAFRHR